MNSRIHPPIAQMAAALLALAVWSTAAPASAQPFGTVTLESRLGSGTGIIGLTAGDNFGSTVAALGDLDGDGTPDLAAGAPGNDDGGTGRGAVYILLLAPGGGVRSAVKISDIAGGFTGGLSNVDAFGAQVAALGDLDGDNVEDIAVLAPFDDDGVNAAGAIWILFLNANGTVKAQQKISQTQGGFAGTLHTFDFDTASALGLGDLDGDGVPDLAVGAGGDDDGGNNHGAVYILFLDSDGTVKTTQKLSQLSGGLSAVLDDNDHFGSALALLPDTDGDGVPELAVGASGDDDGGNNRGAVYVLLLNTNGTVKSTRKISSAQGGFSGALMSGDGFGGCAASLGDVDGDGIADLVVGAGGDDDGGSDFGALWVLFMNTDASVRAQQKISTLSGSFMGTLNQASGFGASGCPHITNIQRAGGIGTAVGSPGDNTGAAAAGSLWLLELSKSASATTTTTTSTTSSTTSTTTTSLPPNCGDANGKDGITATDGLIALQAAVGATACVPCVCDTDASGMVTATDALQILQKAVFVPIILSCPPCS